LHAGLLVQPNDVIAVCTEVFPQQRMVSVDIADYLLMCQPVKGVRVIQAGLRRESVEAFMKRAENDLTPLHPTIILTCFGADNGRHATDSRSLTYYQPTYQAMAIRNLKKTGARTIVIGSSVCADSFYLHNNPAEAAVWNQNLAAFRDADRQVAEKEGVLFADIYSPMLDAMAKMKALYGEKYRFASNDSWDQYPMAGGQLVMAYAMLKALGCDGAIGTITLDLAANTAEATPGHKILSVQNGTIEVESTRYPFCFQGNPEKPESTSGVIRCFPFNDELNRYLLVVKGVTAPKVKVTWGAESREFSGAELGKGINLADSFAAHTPFDANFAKVEAAVWVQQEPQSLFMESFFHNIPNLKKMAPEQAEAVDRLGAAIIAQDRSRNEAAAALVLPVRHTLKVEVLP
jgi:hypothetical protein